MSNAKYERRANISTIALGVVIIAVCVASLFA